MGKKKDIVFMRAVIPSVKMGGKTLESRGLIPDGPLQQ
jgi:hypothetical protein